MRLTFGDMTREVNVLNLGKQPCDVKDETFKVNLIENLTSEHKEELKLETDCDFELESEDFNLDQIIESAVDWTSNPISPNVKPINLTPLFSEPSPSLELKVLLVHLKYVYLGEQETFPVIITSHLNDGQEENLKIILRKYKKAISWIMTYIKRLSPAIVQHHIHLNEEEISKRDPQCRLNPKMLEVVHAEIVKLLDNEIIYPISDSQWVSHVHAVIKKSGFTVVGPNSTSHENLCLHRL